MTRADQMKAALARLEQARGRDYAFGYIRSMVPAHVHYAEQALERLAAGDIHMAQTYLELIVEAHTGPEAEAKVMRKAAL